ncbi:KATNB1-like protein 1 [Denticeps clupeoides]|uniref:KATNB1-like protein 1 n=1 Tax=Denticeps clupeoides TaxID=299321 RepID=UPI0010A2FBC1|nr:KATNB1-like protein 1 [Denticeps clupeoides]
MFKEPITSPVHVQGEDISLPIMFSGDHDDELNYNSSEETLTVEDHCCLGALCNQEEIIKKRNPASCRGNNPGKVKRVLSSKRKTRHLTVSFGGRRRPALITKTCELTGVENQLFTSDMFDSNSSSFSPSNNNVGQMGGKNTDHTEEVSRDHRLMIQVLSGRHLRLKIALTLWKRTVGELLKYIRMQDTSLLVDCLPVITKSLEETSNITIGFCVDLVPLVQNLFKSTFEDYLCVALRWMQSVLKKWWPQFTGNEECHYLPDRNLLILKHQLQDMWEQVPQFCFLLESTSEITKCIESCLIQLQ